MKTTKYLLNFSLIVSLLMTLVACASKQSKQNEQNSPFKMILRTWALHYKDTLVMNDLVTALKEYPTFDVVWLAPDDGSTVNLNWHAHEVAADSMTILSKQLHEMGIEVGIEGLCLGHLDDLSSLLNFSYGDQEANGLTPPWGTAVGFMGEKTRAQSCPRQQAFLDYVGKYYALYVQKNKAEYVWIDDDFRMNNHQPATLICFCDTCIHQFNEEYGCQYTRENLEKALKANDGNGKLRTDWMNFSQESLSGLAKAIAEAVHKVSPQTKIGIEHCFNRDLLVTGRSFNSSFDAIEEITGYPAGCRPGAGFYNDHAPREMLIKAYELARQIRRLNKDMVEIPPEIECYHHASSGKTPRGICLESMLYMAMGGTQLSYAIISSGDEPISWYKTHYFKYLLDWRSDFKKYADFNFGSEPGGIDAYLSPTAMERKVYTNSGQYAWENYTWCLNSTGKMVYDLSTLGIPFSPDGHYVSGYILDKEAVEGLSDEELKTFRSKGILLDEPAWEAYKNRGEETYWNTTVAPNKEDNVKCFITENGGRIAVLPTFSADNVNIKRNKELLQLSDWISYGRLPAIIETQAQMVQVPRVNIDGTLRSLLLLNCSISDQEETTIRLRGCKGKTSFIWHVHGQKDIMLTPEEQNNDILVTIPGLADWMIGWIEIK